MKKMKAETAVKQSDRSDMSNDRSLHFVALPAFINNDQLFKVRFSVLARGNGPSR